MPRQMTRRTFCHVALTAGALSAFGSLGGCVAKNSRTERATARGKGATVSIDSSSWRYNEQDDVYYQLGVAYCGSPQAADYERMNIYVPGAYFQAKKTLSESYTCSPSDAAAIGGFTASTAPIVVSINATDHNAFAAPNTYRHADAYPFVKAGFVCIIPSFRGANMDASASACAPWAVTDLKAAVRTLRANAAVLAGDFDRIFSCGAGVGGGLSAVLGASGGSKEYSRYLTEIGAPTVNQDGATISDAIFGALCWSPTLNGSWTDAAYEWNIGQFDEAARANDSFAQQLSNDLADSYASFINGSGIAKDGASITLANGREGIFCAGSYYDQVCSTIEESLNAFLAATSFPFAVQPRSALTASENVNLFDGTASANKSKTPATVGVVYESAADYIAHLNENGKWLSYNDGSNTVTVANLAGYVAACKQPSTEIGVFDALDLSSSANAVFGSSKNDPLHFDATMAQLLSSNTASYSGLGDWSDAYPKSFSQDLEYTDDMGTLQADRVNMYDPLHYLLRDLPSAGKSTAAAHWRIRGDVSGSESIPASDLNLACAAQAAPGVQSVDWAGVWESASIAAERAGSATENAIAWIRLCCERR